MNKPQPWHLTAEAAELYERFVARHILGPWAPLVVEAARVKVGMQILDVACGTGVVGREAAQRVGPTGRVVGVDLNPAMIAVARSLSAPPAVPIEWLQGSALDLPVDDASFDAVLCQQGLQFFPDKALALREMRRVIRPGGRIALTMWNSAGLYNRAVGEALAQFINSQAAASFCASRQTPVREELECLANEAGFSAIEVSVSRLNIHLPRLEQFALDHLSATPIAPTVAAANPETRAKIGASVAKQLQQYADGSGVTYPEETHLLTANVL